jgi:signal transduction histidine kinase
MKENLHPFYINCRSIQIIQIVFHLLNNSIFEILKLEEKWIEFLSKEDSEFIYLRITDSGKGIPPSISKKIFEPFFSKKDGKSRSTGLGLSIAKVILHEHRGDIQYEPYNGHTSFILKFPKVES